MLTIFAVLIPALAGACVVLLIGCAVEVMRDRRDDDVAEEPAGFTRFDPIAHHSRGCRCVGHR